MAFFNQAINILQTLVVAIGAVLQYGVSSICWKDMVMTTQVQNPRGLSN